MDECDIDEETGHLLCPKPESMDFKDLECTPKNDSADKGVVKRKRTTSPSSQVDIV